MNIKNLNNIIKELDNIIGKDKYVICGSWCFYLNNLLDRIPHDVDILSSYDCEDILKNIFKDNIGIKIKNMGTYIFKQFTITIEDSLIDIFYKTDVDILYNIIIYGDEEIKTQLPHQAINAKYYYMSTKHQHDLVEIISKGINNIENFYVMPLK